MKIIIPKKVKKILGILEENGFKAYIVGGCVRDYLLGKSPYDFDICTDSMPENTAKIFRKNGFAVIETGLKHGTVTINYKDENYEITTFRSENEYQDNRRPKEVTFQKNIADDLKRRDFTINAMAYSEKSGLIDLFEGEQDIKKREICCVGDTNKRFEEDALRIMRGIRFASTLGFEVEEKTKNAMISQKNLLKNISFERINDELSKLLLGENVYKILMDYREIITEIIPEMSACFDFIQHSKHHCYDVYTHIAKSVENAPKSLEIRLCMLLHDIGKPHTFNKDVKTGHFYGHEKVSAEMAKNILNRLKYSKKITQKVVELIAQHDNRYPPTEKNVKKYLSKFGEEFFFEQLEIRLSDTLAQSDFDRESKVNTIVECKKIGEEVIEKMQCFSLKDLQIDGKKIADLGFKGAKIGEILNVLLNEVIEGNLENNLEKLEEKARSLQ